MRRKNNSIPKLHVKKGDTVKVLSGASRGKSGKILAVYPAERKALVEGVNMVTKHRKPDADNPDGSIAKMEAPLDIAKLQLMVGGKPTRVGRKENSEGKMQRYAKSTGDFIKE